MIKVRYKVALADGEIVEAFDEVEGATICPDCFEVHGALVVSGRSRRHYWQRCACERGDEPEERWFVGSGAPGWAEVRLQQARRALPVLHTRAAREREQVVGVVLRRL